MSDHSSWQAEKRMTAVHNTPVIEEEDNEECVEF
jgi:hypothetical protein